MEQRGGGWARAGTIFDRLTGPGLGKLPRETRELCRLANLRTTSDLTLRLGTLSSKREQYLTAAREIEQLPENNGLSKSIKAIGAAENRRMAAYVDVELTQAKHDIADGERRDEMLAERPDGCFCLGAGGKGRVHWIGEAHCWSFPCTCPEAQAVTAAYREAYEEQEARYIAEEEAAARDQSARDRSKYLGRSGIPQRVLGMDWDSYPSPELGRGAIILLQRYEAGAESTQRGVYLWGSVGTGKTCLSQIAVKHFILAGGGPALTMQAAQWLDNLRESFNRDQKDNEESHQILMRNAQRAPLLLVDDIGVEHLTDWAVERLFVLVNYRYERSLPTIYTSNYDIGHLVDRLSRGLADPIRGQRITDRIFETCDQYQLEGDSLRVMSS